MGICMGERDRITFGSVEYVASRLALLGISREQYTANIRLGECDLFRCGIFGERIGTVFCIDPNSIDERRRVTFSFAGILDHHLKVGEIFPVSYGRQVIGEVAVAFRIGYLAFHLGLAEIFPTTSMIDAHEHTVMSAAREFGTSRQRKFECCAGQGMRGKCITETEADESYEVTGKSERRTRCDGVGIIRHRCRRSFESITCSHDRSRTLRTRYAPRSGCSRRRGICGCR